MRVLFCTEGNSRIGFGHVYRCLALAHELKRQGAEPVFDNMTLSLKAEQLVLGAGLSCDAAGYIGPPWEVVVADEHAPRLSIPCAPLVTLLDHTDDIKGRSIPGLKVALMGNPTHDTAVGPEYAILARHITEAKPSPKQYDVTLCFGGADPAGATWLAVEALKGSALKVASLLGPGFKEAERFQKEAPPHVDTYLAPNPAPLFLSSGVVLTSAGMTLWEALHLGCPTIVISQNAREENRARELAARGLCIHMGQPDRFDPWHLAEVIHGLLANDPKRKDMGGRGAALIDGRGIERVARLVFNPPRPVVSPGDTQIVRGGRASL